MATETTAPKARDAERVLPNESAQNAGAPKRRNGRWSGYWQLLKVRLLELKREPEVVFWVFVFPLLLALGLGIAFRNKPADISSVVVIAGEGAQKTVAMLENSPQHSGIRARVLERDAALKAFHFGKFDLAIEPQTDGGFKYYYDPARPESVLSRAEVDAARKCLRFATTSRLRQCRRHSQVRNRRLRGPSATVRVVLVPRVFSLRILTFSGEQGQLVNRVFRFGPARKTPALATIMFA